MAVPMESPVPFANIGQLRCWQRGFFASQSGYVALALLVLSVGMNFASPYFFTEGNIQNVAKIFSFISIATLGDTLGIITGGIVLSVGSMMCFSAMITSMVMSGLSTPGLPGASLDRYTEHASHVIRGPARVMNFEGGNFHPMSG